MTTPSMKRNALVLIFSVLLLVSILSIARPAFAQSEGQLVLRLSKDFGYALGGKIEGTFSMRVTGPEDLTRVVFYIDGQAIGEDSQTPFRLQFQTSHYSLGIHTLSAEGTNAAGQALISNEIKTEFVPPSQSSKILIPVLVVIGAAVLISFIGPMLLGRGQAQSLALGTPRKYGLSGGTICPKCGRPFSIHFFGLNLLVGKLDRCPYCGKWSIVRAYPLSSLRAAEEAEKEQATSEPELLSEEERLKRDLERSRYEDV